MLRDDNGRKKVYKYRILKEDVKMFSIHRIEGQYYVFLCGILVILYWILVIMCGTKRSKIMHGNSWYCEYTFD